MIALFFAGGGGPHKHEPIYLTHKCTHTVISEGRHLGTVRTAQSVCSCDADLLGIAYGDEPMCWQVVEAREPGPFHKYKMGDKS